MAIRKPNTIDQMTRKLIGLGVTEVKVRFGLIHSDAGREKCLGCNYEARTLGGPYNRTISLKGRATLGEVYDILEMQRRALEDKGVFVDLIEINSPGKISRES